MNSIYISSHPPLEICVFLRLEWQNYQQRDSATLIWVSIWSHVKLGALLFASLPVAANASFVFKHILNYSHEWRSRQKRLFLVSKNGVKEGSYDFILHLYDFPWKCCLLQFNQKLCVHMHTHIPRVKRSRIACDMIMPFKTLGCKQESSGTPLQTCYYGLCVKLNYGNSSKSTANRSEKQF